MRWLLMVCGMLCLGIGMVGVVVPLLPTTPLVLLAAACFARSSERFHQWLMRHPRFGPALADWRRSGVIRLPAKILATVLMALGSIVPLYVVTVPTWVTMVVLAIVVPVLLFIWTRPSRSCEAETRPHRPAELADEAVTETGS